MDLDQLHALPTADKWIFVRGRIVSESIDMDAALRGVHAALRGRHDRAALLDGSWMWSKIVDECREMLECYAPIDDDVSGAVRSALDAAAEAWNERNRYMHDLLTARIEGDDDPGTPAEPRAVDDRYRLRLSRPRNAPEVESVTLDDAIKLVERIAAAMWRLRAARHCLVDESWRSMLLGHVEGDWEGNVSWVGADDDD